MTRRLRMGLWLLGLLHAAVLLAGFLAPYPYAEQHREFPYAPPTRIHWQGVRPFVYGLVAEAGSEGYREDAEHRFPIRFWTGGRLFGVDPPGVLFLTGSDAYGRDVFSRLLYGGQVSLLTGILAAAVALALGVTIGTIAGFFGGWVDTALMRGGEVFLALPWLYLLLAVRGMLPLHISPIQAFLLLIAIIGGVGWVRPSRLV